MVTTRRGRIITFYSYKGGVGRSMALANVAALFAKWNRRVLVLDWDLEAPGIEKFFEAEGAQGRGRALAEQRLSTPGIVDIIQSFEDGHPIAWQECVISVAPFGDKMPLSLISAGRDDAGYASKVRSINWERLFSEHEFGDYLEMLRNQWISEFDYVLVDSRTGVTDSGGVCSIHLPDVVVAMFTANQQSVEGVKRVLMSLQAAHEQLPLDRFRLQLVPVPGRDESLTEHEKSQEWREIFARELAEFYQSWLPEGYSPRRVLERLKIPYKPYWSFGERLPAVLEGTSDPVSVGYAYAVLAKLLLGDLNWLAVASDELSQSDGSALRRPGLGRSAAQLPQTEPGASLLGLGGGAANGVGISTQTLMPASSKNAVSLRSRALRRKRVGLWATLAAASGVVLYFSATATRSKADESRPAAVSSWTTSPAIPIPSEFAISVGTSGARIVHMSFMATAAALPSTLSPDLPNVAHTHSVPKAVSVPSRRGTTSKPAAAQSNERSKVAGNKGPLDPPAPSIDLFSDRN